MSDIYNSTTEYDEYDSSTSGYEAYAEGSEYDAYDAYGATEDKAGYGEGYKYDYTVLAVALITLGLVLPVEILKHKIDHKAIGRPFAKTVLDFLWSELSTLGIVEATIYIVQNYAKSWDKKVKDVFAKVHFLLFFAACFNAFMSVLFAYVSSSVSQRMWVRTEELELDHYIAIREEFDRVEAQIKEYENGGGDTHWWTRIVQMIKHPMVQSQYHKLLVQVRFHELRVHFLKANNLPFKFRVSDYLMKQELHVFQKIVHISTFAWIMIAAAINLCYFLMGMITYTTESQRIVGTTLSWIFIGGLISFVPISYAVYKKMQWIFGQIMKKDLIDWTGDDEDDLGSSAISYGGDVDIENPPPSKMRSLKRGLSYSLNIHLTRRSVSTTRSKALRQLDLFWGGDPNLIIGTFQAMQLCYSIAGAILLIFWEAIDVHYAAVGAKGFILSLLFCYLTFLLIMAQVIPRYTLCTSLGQLVNRRRVRETLATYKLEEVRKQRQHGHEEEAVAAAAEHEVSPQDRNTSITFSDEKDSPRSSSTSASSGLPSRPARMNKRSISRESQRMTKLAELVQTSTADLPKLPSDVSRKSKSRLKKSHSDGVAVLRLLGDDKISPPLVISSESTKSALSSTGVTAPPPTASSTRGRRNVPREKSVSANVALMQSPAASMYLHGSSSFASEEKEEESCTPSESGLAVLMEDIPARSVDPSELVVPVGRTDEDDVESASLGNDNAVTKSSYNTAGDHISKESDGTSNTSDSDGGGNVGFSTEPPSVKIIDKTHDHASHAHSDHHHHRFDLQTLRTFLQSRFYRLLSGVFGTMLLFFVIGMRVEAFLLETGAMPDYQNTWNIRSLSGAFWWEVSWLSTFITVSLISCFIFSKDCAENDTLHRVYANAFDVLLSGLCLWILLYAETQRCCESGPDCCEKFGSRTYGGLGDIEPFTALIALRVFRFKIGRLFRRMFKRNVSGNKSAFANKTKSVREFQKDLVQEHLGLAQRSVRGSDDDVKRQQKARHHFGHEMGTAFELWKTAAGLYPDIVEKHGEISKELLEAMLGLHDEGH